MVFKKENVKQPNPCVDEIVKGVLAGLGVAVPSIMAGIDAKKAIASADKDSMEDQAYLADSKNEKQFANLKLENEKLAYRLELEKEKFNYMLEESEKRCKELKNDKNKLEADNYRLQKEFDELKMDRNRLAHGYNEAIAEYKKEMVEKEKDVSRLEDAYNAYVDKIKALQIPDLIEAYSLFNRIGERTRNNLRAVFETDTFLGFVSNSMQWERIAGIWEQTKRKIVNEDQEDVEVLRELFKALIKIYNAGYNEEPFKLIIPKTGSRYNSENSVIIGHKSDGVVKEVLLEGYVRVRDNFINNALIQVD